MAGPTNGSTKTRVTRSRDDYDFLINEAVLNAISSRTEWFRKLTDPRRDIYDECGFPRGWVAPEVYQDLYDRDPYAARVVELMPKECWTVQPHVYESEDNDEITEFEQAWDDLGRMLLGQASYFKREGGQCDPLMDVFRQLDVSCGVGQYGILLIGLDDGEEDMSRPVRGVEERGSKPVVENRQKDAEGKTVGVTYSPFRPEKFGQVERYSLTTNAVKDDVKRKGGRRELTYLRVYTQAQAPVTQWEANRLSPRYGQPVMYRISINDSREDTGYGFGLAQATIDVHWTRVVHVADNTRSNPCVGMPRMQQVLNNLLSLQKISGASPEGYWKTCFTHLFFETHPQLGGDVEVDDAEMKDLAERLQNGLQKIAWLRGMSAKPVAPTMVDPTPHIDKQVEAICVKMEVPVPVFKGYEIGEQASTENKTIWNDRRRGRWNSFIIPRLIVPCVDRFIMLGLLPEPNGKVVRVLDETEDETEETTSPVIPEDEDPEPTDEGGKGEAVENAESNYDAEFAPPNPKPVKDKKGKGKSKDDEGEEHGYYVEVPDFEGQTEADKAAIAAQKTQTLVTYVEHGGNSVVQPMDFLVEFLGIDEDRAAQFLENTIKAQSGDSDHDTRSPLLSTVGGATAFVELFKAAKEGVMDEEQLKETMKLLFDLSDERVEAIIADGLTPTAEEAGMGAEAQVGLEKAKIDAGVAPDPTEVPPPGPVKVKPGEKLVTPPPAVNYDPTQPRVQGGSPQGGQFAGKDGSPGGAAGIKARAGAARDQRTPTPECCPPHRPDVEATDHRGLTTHARVGVPAHDLPPPPNIPRMPNLAPAERKAETEFAEAFEADPDGMAARFREKVVEAAAKKGKSPAFGTDDFKEMYEPWNGSNLTLEERSKNRATLNVALHQTGNAGAKRAFVQHLDTLAPGDEVMVTVGGCGAGKGYAINSVDKETGQPNVPQAAEVMGRSKVVWDSAGDQNATENQWVLDEARKRGLKTTFVYVHADPKNQWSNPKMGVVARAGKPEDGRMVDANVYADSYSIGARNHDQFARTHSGAPDVGFVYVQNGPTPRAIDGIPPEALRVDRKGLAKFAAQTLLESDAPDHVKHGGTIGTRVWDSEWGE